MASDSDNAHDFLTSVGKYLGVEPASIFVRRYDGSGVLHLGGPVPTNTINFPLPYPFPHPPKPPEAPELPREFEYCITIVLEIPLPSFICRPLFDEYNELKSQVERLVERQAWRELAIVAERLAELERKLEACREPRSLVIEYCIFPID